MNEFDSNADHTTSTDAYTDVHSYPGAQTNASQSSSIYPDAAHQNYQQPPPQYIYIQPKPIHTASIVLGILSLCFLWLGIGGMVLGIIGVALARKAKKNNYNSQVGFGISLVGMIIGIILTGFLILMPIFMY